MNEKGIFSTLVAFFLILAMFEIIAAVEKQKRGAEEKIIFSSALQSTQKIFENISYDIVYLSREGKALKKQVRLLPFDYVLSKNTAAFSEELPLAPDILQAYYDFLLNYAVFVRPHFQDVNISVQTVNSGEALDYVVRPQCLVYRVINDKKYALITGGTSHGCLAPFSLSDLNAISLRVTFKQDDFNRFICNIGGGGCQRLPFDPANTNPFIEIKVYNGPTFLDSVSKHFDRTRVNHVFIEPKSGGGLIKTWFGHELLPEELFMLEDIAGKKIRTDLNLSFEQDVESIDFNGFNARVSKPLFDINFSNKP